MNRFVLAFPFFAFAALLTFVLLAMVTFGRGKDTGIWGFFQTRGFIFSLVVIIIVLVLALGLIGFYQSEAQSAELPTASPVYGDFRYEVVEIDGMPCVVASGGNYFGITCDWTKWDGRNE